MPETSAVVNAWTWDGTRDDADALFAVLVDSGSQMYGPSSFERVERYGLVEPWLNITWNRGQRDPEVERVQRGETVLVQRGRILGTLDGAPRPLVDLEALKRIHAEPSAERASAGDVTLGGQVGDARKRAEHLQLVGIPGTAEVADELERQRIADDETRALIDRRVALETPTSDDVADLRASSAACSSEAPMPDNFRDRLTALLKAHQLVIVGGDARCTCADWNTGAHVLHSEAHPQHQALKIVEHLAEIRKARLQESAHRWYVGAMNDGLFIIDTPPRPSTDDVWPDRLDGPTLVLNVAALTAERIGAIVDAHNESHGIHKKPERRAWRDNPQA